MPKLSLHYDYKYEGIPLVHDIFRNIASCESKMKNYSEALSLLDSAKGWQKVCEGNSPNCVLTETMIQQVHRSQGDEKRVKESQAEIVEIKKSYPVSENQNIKESLVNVNLDFDFNLNINDSAVNIDLG